MKPIEGRRPVHKDTDTDQPNQMEENEKLDDQENEKLDDQENEDKTKEKKGKSTPSKPNSHSRDNQRNIEMKASFIIAILAILFAVAWKYDLFSEVEGVIGIAKGRETTDESNLSEDLETLEDTYSKQDLGTWVRLASGIKSVVRENPNKPSVFLMLYDTDSAGKTAKCIAVDVSKKATKYLIRRVESPVIINPNELADQRYLQDPGLVLTEYNHTIRERGALVVPNLQEVPPKVAEIFHFICDRYSPLVETAVMFFTLKVEESPKNVKLQEVATQTLQKLWSKSMKDTTLNPLITRMTPNIVNIFSDYANC